jgi:hypothetical protein
MTTEARATYEGKWRRLVNLVADRKGSIHDDEAARSLGFEAAFVPGSTVATAAMPALFHFFGERWMEGGWYVFKFVTPVYTSNDVRETGRLEDSGSIEVRLETSEGRLCCTGMAGLGYERPWDATQDGRQGAGLALPGVELGITYDEREFQVSAESSLALLDSAGDETPWYRDASAWGPPLVPPERLMNVALDLTRSRRLQIDGVRNPGMWAEHALALRKPLFIETPYVIREHVADKGRSGRTVFLTYEFSIHSLEGEELASGRHKVKWLAAAP